MAKTPKPVRKEMNYGAAVVRKNPQIAKKQKELSGSGTIKLNTPKKIGADKQATKTLATAAKRSGPASSPVAKKKNG